MTFRRTLFNTASDALIVALRLNAPVRAYRAFLARVNSVQKVRIDGTDMTFDANDELHLWRAQTLASKEPETLAWIDSFEREAVFFDIGANIGVFSVYAGLRRDCDVYAFEPEAKNYACLNKNLLLNGLGRKVKALNAGLHDSTGIEFLQLHGLESGAALHALGQPIDQHRNRFEPKFEQAVLAFTLDDLVRRFGLPAPNHVKIDVDGNEGRIIEGGKGILSAPSLRSLLIEMDARDPVLQRAIESCGLRVTERTRCDSAGDTYNTVFRRA